MRFVDRLFSDAKTLSVGFLCSLDKKNGRDICILHYSNRHCFMVGLFILVLHQRVTSSGMPRQSGGRDGGGTVWY